MRGPFTRWPRGADATLAVIAFVATLITVATQDGGDSLDFDFELVERLPPAAYILLVVACAALYWRRRRPLAVFALVVVVLIIWSAAGFSGDPALVVVVALYSVGRYVEQVPPTYAAVGIAISLAVVGEIVDNESVGVIGTAVVFTFLPWYIGRRLGIRTEYLDVLRERAEYLEREREAEAQRVVAEERARIARELHDVVAHRVSMMTVQAGAANTIADEDPRSAKEAMGAVEHAGREALSELRHLLGVLRPPGGNQALDHPQQGIADIPGLVSEFRQTGIEIRLAAEGMPVGLPSLVELSAYRIVQEALTNVLKHGGPTSTCDVTVAVDGGQVVVDVANDGSRTASLPGSGHGIIGMRERVTMLGGTLDAGPRSGGGYRVVARIPTKRANP